MTKPLLIISLISLIIAPALAPAQTKATPTQIGWPTDADPAIILLLPTGPVFVKLDPGSLTYNPATMTIYAKVPNYEISLEDELLKPTASGTTTIWRMPPGCVPRGIYKNGVRQTAIADPPKLPDYDQTSKDITGNVITWRPTSAPAATDTIIVTCGKTWLNGVMLTAPLVPPVITSK